jgi:hypothetical protein
MSCVTSPSKLCVGVDLIGRVVYSSNPDAATPTWTRLIGVDGANTLVDIACPSASLCATVDNAGNAVTSTDGGANWATKAGIDGTTHRFWALGCPSASMCVAGDGAGNFVTSTNPGAGASATWTVQSGTDPGNIIHDVSCVLSPSTLCVAVDDSGNVLTSTDPTDGSSWSIEPVNDGSISLDGVSCPSISLCVAVDNAGNVYVADRGNRRIQVFSSDLVLRNIYDHVGAPWTVCVTPGPHQYLYSSNSNPDNNDSRVAAVSGEVYKMELDGTVVGKFGQAGKALKDFTTIHEIDCKTDNDLVVGEIDGYRVQHILLHPATRTPSSR